MRQAAEDRDCDALRFRTFRSAAPLPPGRAGSRHTAVAASASVFEGDPLRRSLVPAGVLLFWLVGWLCFPRAAALWTLLGLLVPAFPVLTQLALLSVSPIRDWPHRTLSALRDIAAARSRRRSSSHFCRTRRW